MTSKMLLGFEKQSFPIYDMVIDDEAFFDMEITLSPKISMGNRTIVENLIDKYNPQAIIKDSTLLGLIWLSIGLYIGFENLYLFIVITRFYYVL